MSDESLLKQLANRTKDWHRNTGITQAAMAAKLNMGEANYSKFLSAGRSIGAEATCSLLEYLKLPTRQAIAKFNKPVLSSQILRLQERGKPMRFSNDGGVPREGGTDDPNGTSDITSTTDAQKATIADLLNVFNTLDSLTRQTVIDAITKAHANANGSTPATTQKFRKRSK